MRENSILIFNFVKRNCGARATSDWRVISTEIDRNGDFALRAAQSVYDVGTTCLKDNIAPPLV